MINEKLLDDTATATALHVIEIFNLRDEEKLDAFREVYERVKGGIEAYVRFVEQESYRLYRSQPGSN